MDDLISYCVEEIALDGEQGTPLERLWTFAHDFQLTKASLEEALPDFLDHAFKKRLWRHLLMHNEIIVKAGDNILHAPDGRGIEGISSKKSSTAKTASLQDLDSLLEKYNDSLILVTSENKQWTSVTGLPKSGNPVPNLHFKLLSCISQARAEGISQVEAAKRTKQDPRSFPMRTKLLVELGLLTKTPIIQNGNNTYRLTHTRYVGPPDSKNISLTNLSVPPKAGASSQTITNPSNNEVIPGSIEDISDSLSIGSLGFTRDQTIGEQVRQAIGKSEWDKKGLIDKLKAEHFKVPIESFLEKASLSKPTPIPRAVTQNKIKEAATRPAEPSIQPLTLGTAGSHENSLSIMPATTKRKSKEQSILLETQPFQQSLVNVSVTPRKSSARLNEQTGPQDDRDNTDIIQDTPKKRKLSSNPPKALKSKRRKTSQQMPAELRRARIPLSAIGQFQTIGRNFISLMKINDGIFELIPRLDLEYAAHVEKFCPGSDARVDGKLLMHVLDDLEARGEIVRIMLSTVTPIRTTQYKSVLVLPEIDAGTNPKINALREELQRDADSYKFAPIESGLPQLPAAPSTGPTALEIVQNSSNPPQVPPVPLAVPSQQRPANLAPIPVAIPPSQPTRIAPIPTLIPSKPVPVKETRKRGLSRRKSPKESTPIPESYDSIEEDNLETDTKGGDEDDALAKRRRISFYPEEDKKIYQAVSLMKKYIGSTSTPWTMLKPILPDRKGMSIKRRYENLQVTKKEEINRFLDVFGKNYFEAQERGEVKPIQTGPAFDLEYCLNWYRNGGFEAEEEQPALPRPKSRRTLQLPQDLADFFRYYEIEESVTRVPWRSDYYKKEGASSSRRKNSLFRETYMIPDPPDRVTLGLDEKSQRLESLIKATVLTPEVLHDKHKTKQVLANWGTLPVTKTVQALVEKRLLTRTSSDRERMAPGRNYRLSERWGLAVRSHMADNLLDEGQAFYYFLAGAFEQGKEVLISELTNDGSVFCLLSLLASQEITLKPSRQDFHEHIPSKMYRGRAIDKEGLEFSVIVERTAKFSGQTRFLPTTMAPVREPGEPQAWITVNDELLGKPLDVLKRMILSLVHKWPAISKEEIVATTGGVLTHRECDVLLQSLQEDGLIKAKIPCIPAAGFVTCI